MSITINMVGGGGGISNNNALIVARIPSGSTVTATKGSLTLAPKMWASGTLSGMNVALFVLLPSQFDSSTPWTITATNGTSTASEDVLVTTNNEYDVTLVYNLVLWDYVRDGYSGLQSLAYISSGYTWSQDTGECVRFYFGGTGAPYILFNSTIDFSKYSTLEVIGNSGDLGGNSLGIVPTDSTEYILSKSFINATSNIYIGADNTLSVSTYNQNGRVKLQTGNPSNHYELFISHVELLP